MKIDAHQHFWRYSAASYRWIRADVLKRDYLPADLRPLLAAAGFDGTILVQARSTWEETHWLLELAHAHPWITGVVGWADLCVPDLPERLAHLTIHPEYRGVRCPIETEPEDPGIPRADFVRGIAELTAAGLTFDLLVTPSRLPLARALVEAAPQQRFILDHIGNPDIANAATADRDAAFWAGEIRRLAAHPNVACKVSGMVTRANHAAWQPSDFIPFLDTIFEAFGPERLMVGSDWPVCLQAAPYAETIGIVIDYMKPLPSEMQEAVLGGTAARWYGVGGI